MKNYQKITATIAAIFALPAIITYLLLVQFSLSDKMIITFILLGFIISWVLFFLWYRSIFSK